MSGLIKGFPPVAELKVDEKEHRRELAKKINLMNAGKVNCTQTGFTLNTSATTTTLTDSRLYANTYVDFMPTTAHAAAAKVAGMWVTGQKKGSCTVNHTSSANTDQVFTALIIGTFWLFAICSSPWL